MEKLSGGYINEAFKRDTQVVKYYQECPTVYVPVDVRFNNEVSSLMHYGGRLAPLIYQADFANKIITMEYLVGDSMKHHVDNGTGKREKDELFEGFGNVLRQIHHDPEYTPVSSYASYIRKKAMADYHLFAESHVPEMFSIDMERVMARMVRTAIPEVTRRAGERGRLSKTHGDIWSNNMIAGKAIDWEFAGVGLPEEDLVQVYMWDLGRFPDQQEAFERGYGEKLGDLRSFQLLKLLDYMEAATVEQVESEDDSGFLRVHARMIAELIK